jgi:Tfp pilus assembly protein PilF
LRSFGAFVLLVAGLGTAGCARDGAKAQSASAAREDKDPAVLVEAGTAYYEAGDMLRAEQYLSAALKAGAEEKAVLPMLLRACVESKHYRLAQEVADTALAREPRNAPLRFLVGSLFVATGQAPTARPYLEQAADELPEDADVQFAVAVFFRDDLGDVARADTYFRRYLDVAPSGSHADEARASLMEQLQ